MFITLSGISGKISLEWYNVHKTAQQQQGSAGPLHPIHSCPVDQCTTHGASCCCSLVSPRVSTPLLLGQQARSSPLVFVCPVACLVFCCLCLCLLTGVLVFGWPMESLELVDAGKHNSVDTTAHASMHGASCSSRRGPGPTSIWLTAVGQAC